MNTRPSIILLESLYELPKKIWANGGGEVLTPHIPSLGYTPGTNSQHMSSNYKYVYVELVDMISGSFNKTI